MNHVQAKKPAGEDLSRWENEGGQPSMSSTPTRDKRLQQLLASAPNLERLRARVEAEVRQRPLAALAIASAIGFVLGGGLRTRSGRRMLQRALAVGLDSLTNLKT